jgi:hypothetical protein
MTAISESLIEHDTRYTLYHPNFYGVIDQSPPLIENEIKDALIFRLTENILSDRKAAYGNDGDFRHMMAQDSYDMLKNKNNIYLSQDPLTVQEIRRDLEDSYIGLTHTRDYLEIYQHVERTEGHLDGDDKLFNRADKQRDNLAKLIKSGEITINISDNEIEYYKMRAELLKERLEEAGYSSIDLRNSDVLREINPQIFIVSKDEVINTLNEKRVSASLEDEHLSINTPIYPSCSISSHGIVNEGKVAEPVLAQSKGGRDGG